VQAIYASVCVSLSLANGGRKGGGKRDILGKNIRILVGPAVLRPAVMDDLIAKLKTDFGFRFTEK
jgi:hypothetical protein